jgi:hypothetical protein
MARWKLMEAHYIYSPDIEWEYKETGASGRTKKVVHKVPIYLNPEFLDDCNYKGDPEVMIAICHEGKGLSKDIIFLSPDGGPGVPGPNMFPLDEEAGEISRKVSHLWTNPIDHAAEGNLSSLMQDIRAIKSTVQPSSSEVDSLRDQVGILTAQTAAIMEMNKLLMAKLEPTQAYRR